MYHPTDKITHTMKDRSDDPSHREQTLFTTELHLVPILNSSLLTKCRHSYKNYIGVRKCLLTRKSSGLLKGIDLGETIYQLDT